MKYPTLNAILIAASFLGPVNFASAQGAITDGFHATCRFDVAGNAGICRVVVYPSGVIFVEGAPPCLADQIKNTIRPPTCQPESGGWISARAQNTHRSIAFQADSGSSNPAWFIRLANEERFAPRVVIVLTDFQPLYR